MDIKNRIDALPLVRRTILRGLILAAGLGVWYLSQHWIGTRVSTGSGVDDAVHHWTAGANAWLAVHSGWTDGLLIVSSFGIDAVALGLFLWGIVGKSSRPLVGVLVLFALRQAAQATTALPVPPGMLWRSPGFPSLFVTYSVGNDFFFSGHTALAVFSALEWGRCVGKAGKISLAFFALSEAVVVLVLRAHYTLDVLTGAAMAAMVWFALNHFWPQTRRDNYGG